MIERGDKDGHHFENRAAWVSRYEGDRIVEVTTHDLDGAATRAFWDAVGPA
jgi:ketosteroid isomerase-like protein